MRGRASGRAGLGAALCAIVLGLGAAGATASAPRARVAEVPQLPARATPEGPVAGRQVIGLTVSLASRDPLGLERLATAVSTPGSPQFRRFLSVSRFAARFGASPARIAELSRVLRGDGLRVAPVAADRLLLQVSGPAARVQAAFATRLSRVRLVGGRIAYASRTVPTLPAAVAADVDGVVGLDSLAIPRADPLVARRAPRQFAAASPLVARADVATGGAEPCPEAMSAQAAIAGQDGGFGGYSGDVVGAAYDFAGVYGAGDLGAGQTVAVYELETLKPADARHFQACYGATGTLTYHSVDHPPVTATDPESALDVDQVISLAPAANVAVYDAPDTGPGELDEYERIISSDTARTISTSWGQCEAQVTDDGRVLALVRAENKLFEEAAVQGQSVIAASGDTGSEGCVTPHLTDTGLAVGDPASQPFVTGVGGTSLYAVDATGSAPWNPDVPGEPAPVQSVWNDGVQTITPGEFQASATGGGLSQLWRMPSYQSRASARLGVRTAAAGARPCHSIGLCRAVPDVSADGDPRTGYLSYSTDGAGSDWSVVGGTSAAAPLWAAITALADASPTCRGTTVGFENPSLYTLAGRTRDLEDVTLGSPQTDRRSNDALGIHHGAYPVRPGYDLATGLGTPNVAAVAGGLCGLRAPVYRVVLGAPRVRRVIVHRTLRLRVRGRDSGGLRLSYRARGLPPGVRISARGVITGRPGRLGRYAVLVSAVDHATNTARIAFVLRVVVAPGTLRRHP